jgi:hypothetical protein
VKTYVIILAALLLAPLAALHAAETLYNGVVLPEVWPPEGRDPQSAEPMPVPYLQSPPRVIAIDVGRQLFLDDFLIESTDLKRTFHRARKHDGNPVFKPETAEEQKGFAVYTGNGGIFFDPAEQVFKLFYTAGWRGGLALATSRDMIRWTRPELGMAGGNLILPAGVKWNGGPVITSAGSDNSVWLDLGATNPAERLKFMTCWMHVDPKDRPPGFHHTLNVSANGRTWAPEVRTTVAAHDYSTFFFNPFRKVWVASIRYNNDTRRPRRRKYFESRGFIAAADWAKAVYWTGADTLDAPEPPDRYPGGGGPPQLYGLNAVAYESLMVGMHYIHRGPSNQAAVREKVPKLIDLELGFSRDGFHWHRPDRRAFIAGARREGAWDRAYLLGAAGVFVVLGDQLVFPYSGCAGIGTDGSRGIYTGISIGLATLRRDGFASLDEGDTIGTLTTRPISFTGKHLFVNVNTVRGTLRAEVLDANGLPIAPFTLTNCTPVSVDSTLTQVAWGGASDLSALRGKPVRLRFELTGGSLYAFWISRDASGRSDGYVAAGGPGYPGVLDTVGRAASGTKQRLAQP